MVVKKKTLKQKDKAPKTKKTMAAKKMVTSKKTKIKSKAPVKTKAKIKAKVKVAKAKTVKPVSSQKVAKPAPVVKIKSEKVETLKNTSSPVVIKPTPRLSAAEKDVPERIIPKKGHTSTVIGSLNFTPYDMKKGELYMNEEQKEHFRKILEMWKKQLMKEVDETVGHLKEDAIVYPDPLDRASQEQGFNLELRTRDRERKLIKKIEQALDALKKGEYGYCEDCGAEIGIRRLEARPTADKCIDCKTYEEIREKQVGAV